MELNKSYFMQKKSRRFFVLFTDVWNADRMVKFDENADPEDSYKASRSFYLPRVLLLMWHIRKPFWSAVKATAQLVTVAQLLRSVVMFE